MPNIQMIFTAQRMRMVVRVRFLWLLYENCAIV